MPSLVELIQDHDTDIHVIAKYLDTATEPELREEIQLLDRPLQRKLYWKAAVSPPLSLDHFVPAGVAPLQPVVHQGRNTLPLPQKHKNFQKPFCRPEAGGDRLFGYNESPSRGLIGPGYFVAYSCADKEDWAERGSVVIDYFQFPDGPVAAGWPAVVPNTQGLQRFVYQGTRDFMRRVSEKMSIGAAYKGEKSLGHYFVLLRLSGE